MQEQTRNWTKAIAVGLGTAILLSLIMVPASRAGISPMPKPLGFAFAQTLFGPVPMPVGILLHVGWVTFWSAVYCLWMPRTFLNALWLALALWVLVLVVFFPIVGWGLLGMAPGPMLIVGSLVPHVLFAIFLWGLARLAWRASARS